MRHFCGIRRALSKKIWGDVSWKMKWKLWKKSRSHYISVRKWNQKLDNDLKVSRQNWVWFNMQAEAKLSELIKNQRVYAYGVCHDIKYVNTYLICQLQQCLVIKGSKDGALLTLSFRERKMYYPGRNEMVLESNRLKGHGS